MVVLSIDTVRDSPEEIRKTIRYLQELVGEQQHEVKTDPEPQPSEGFLDLFGSSPPHDSAAGEEEDEPQPDKEDESVIEIVEYD